MRTSAALQALYNPIYGQVRSFLEHRQTGSGRGVTFDVKYSTSSMRTQRLEHSGTSAGSVTGQDGSPYTEVNLSTPAVPRAPSMYVAIRPRMPVGTVTVPSQIQLTTNVRAFPFDWRYRAYRQCVRERGSEIKW